MKTMKRAAAILLAVILAVQGFGMDSLLADAAASRAPEDYLHELDLVKFEASGPQGIAGGVFIIGSSVNPDASGNERAAAYISGETAATSDSNLSNTRVGGMEFTLKNGVTAAEINSATLTINVQDVNENMAGAAKWTKAALFETDNPSAWALTAEDQVASVIAAKNNDYSYGAAIYSNERISGSDPGEKTFDVTNAVKNAINDGSSRIVLRLQTVMSGWYVYDGDSQYAPTLIVDTTPTTSATVNLLDKEDNSVIKTEPVTGLVIGETYTYTPENNFTENNTIYIYDSGNANNVLSIADLADDPAGNILSVYYRKAEITGPVNPISADTYTESAPVLPATVSASLENGAFTQTLPVTWDAIDPSQYAEPGSFTVNGSFNAGPYASVGITATVNVYEKPGDNKELKEAIAEVAGKLQELAEDDYTADSWEALQTALAAARTVADDTTAVQAVVDEAKEDLEAAFRALAKITYSVTYIPNNGINGLTQLRVEKGAAAPEPEGIKWSGYTLDGWFLPGAATPYDFNTPVTANIRLTAKWTAIPVVKTDISGASVTVAKTVYNGKTQTPKVTVKYGTKTLVLNKDYTVIYKNNKNAGKATAAITGIGDYTGTKTANFNIIPKANKISKLTNKKGKTLVVKISKSKSADGYEISYSTSKKFKSSKKKSTTKTSVTLSKLKMKKKYYVRVRAYKKIDGKKVYSAYSKPKTKTIKK